MFMLMACVLLVTPNLVVQSTKVKLANILAVISSARGTVMGHTAQTNVKYR